MPVPRGGKNIEFLTNCRPYRKLTDIKREIDASKIDKKVVLNTRIIIWLNQIKLLQLKGKKGRKPIFQSIFMRFG